MVLVNLSIDGRRCLFVAMFDYLLVHDCGCYFFMNGGIMVSSLMPNNDSSVSEHLMMNNAEWIKLSTKMFIGVEDINIHEFADCSLSFLHFDRW